MSNKENEVLDSLLDSLSDDQEMKKKINEFARNKERQRRIQRARATSEQFQQTYSRSSQQESSGDSIEKTREQPAFNARSVNTEHVPEPEKTYESIDIPDFMRSHNVSDQTINLNELHDQRSVEDSYDQRGQVVYDDGIAEETRQFNQNEYGQPVRRQNPASNRYPNQNIENTRVMSNQGVENTRVMPGQQHPQPRQDFGGTTRPVTRMENVQDAAYRNNGDMGSTRVFNNQSQPAPRQNGGTVRMDPNEIRNLLDQEEPILKREYIQDDEDYYDDLPYHRPGKKKKRGSGAKGALISGAIILGIAAVVGGGFALKSFIDSTVANQDFSNEGYDDLMDWLGNYNSYSDDEKMDILNFRKTYEKLSDDARAKVNDLIQSLTGKSFDELLAIAQMGDKPDSSMENVANAEKKAKIREQIEQLESEVGDLSKQLETIKSRINNAEKEYNDKQSTYNAYQSDLDAANSALEDYQSQLNSLPTIDDLQSQLIILQTQLDRLEANDANEASRKSMEERVANLQQQINTHSSTQADLEAKISQEQHNVQQIQSQVTQAKSDMDTAYGAWQAIKSDGDPLQEQIDAKNEQIDKLKAEMDSIK